MSVCQGCGAPLPPKTWQGRDQKWCSVRCRKNQYDLKCVDCGARVSGTDPGRMADRDNPVCTKCAAEHYAVWTRDAIVLAIREWADEHGEPPRATDWHSSDETHPWFGHVQNRFGSWNAGIEAAGFVPRPIGCYGRPGENPAVIAETARLYRAGVRVTEIARTFGVDPMTVYYRLEKAGEPRTGATPRYPPETRGRVIDAYLAGATIQQAADVVGVNYVTAWRWLNKAGIPRRRSSDYRKAAA